MQTLFFAVAGATIGTLCGLLLLWSDSKKRRIIADAQVQRFERLEFFLHCCTYYEHLDQFDRMCEKELTAKDCRLQRYFWLMVERGKKEREICGSEIMLQNNRIRETEQLLKSINLQ